MIRYPKCREELMRDSCDIVSLLKNAVDQFEMVAPSPGAVEDMARENTELLQKIKQLEQERDAAIKDIPRACGYCKHYVHSKMLCRSKYPCAHVSGVNTRWEWRGVCEGNGGTP
jgi:hypothetical protein